MTHNKADSDVGFFVPVVLSEKLGRFTLAGLFSFSAGSHLLVFTDDQVLQFLGIALQPALELPGNVSLPQL